MRSVTGMLRQLWGIISDRVEHQPQSQWPPLRTQSATPSHNLEFVYHKAVRLGRSRSD